MAGRDDTAKERLIFMLHLYLDETGTHEAAGNLGVAGYLAKQEQWDNFNVEWQEALDAYGITLWHQTEFINGWGQFAGWPAHKKPHRLTVKE